MSVEMFESRIEGQARFQPISIAEASNLPARSSRSEEHTSELQSRPHLVCRLLLEKKNKARVPCFAPVPNRMLAVRSPGHKGSGGGRDPRVPRPAASAKAQCKQTWHVSRSSYVAQS